MKKFGILYILKLHRLLLKKYFLGFTGDIDVINWMDEEAIEKLKEDREPFEAPTSHYIPKPEERGKLLWFSGKVLHMNWFLYAYIYYLWLLN